MVKSLRGGDPFHGKSRPRGGAQEIRGSNILRDTNQILIHVVCCNEFCNCQRHENEVDVSQVQVLHSQDVLTSSEVTINTEQL